MSDPDEGRVPCPWCAEPIMADAVVCRFCGRATHPLEPAPAKESSGYGCLIACLVVGVVLIVMIFMGISSNYG